MKYVTLLIFSIFFSNQALAQNKCFETQTDAIKYITKNSSQYFTSLEFKTGDIVTIGNKTIIIKQAQAYHTGSVDMVLTVTSDLNFGIVKSEIEVFENKITNRKHCAQQISQGL